MATYATELEALNALYDLVETVSTDLATVKTDLATVKADLADVKTDVDAVASSTAHTDTVVGNISGFIDGTEALLGDIRTNQVTANTKLDTIHADVDGVETTIGLIKTATDDGNTKLDIVNSKLTTLHTDVDGVEGKLDTLHADVDQVESKLDTANTNLTEIIGETIDVRNVPTDTCIIRIYIGDRTEKREAASRAVTQLLTDGYRPYMVMGISEDLARVLFVKYPAPNNSETPTP